MAIRWRIPPENWCGYARNARFGSGIRTSSSNSSRAALGGRLPEAEVKPHVVRQLRPDGEHRMKRRHRILEHHRDLTARHAASFLRARARAARGRRGGRSPVPKLHPAAIPELRASTSSCRCRSRPRPRTPLPHRRDTRLRRPHAAAVRQTRMRTVRSSTSSKLIAPTASSGRRRRAGRRRGS